MNKTWATVVDVVETRNSMYAEDLTGRYPTKLVVDAKNSRLPDHVGQHIPCLDYANRLTRLVE